MAVNEIYRDADSVPYPVAADVVSGDLVVFASGLVGVAETTAKDAEGGGKVATIRTKGIYAFALGTGALAAGVSVYASTTAAAGVGTKGTLTATASGNTKVGTVYRGKAAAAGTVYVRVGA